MKDQQIQDQQENDKKIQDLLGKQDFAGEELSIPEMEGLEKYRLLFEVLDKEPLVQVPSGFSAMVTASVAARKAKVNDFKFYLLIAVIGVFGIGIAFLFMLFMDKQSASLLLNVITEYKWVWLFTIFSFFAVQYMDRRIIVHTAEKS